MNSNALPTRKIQRTDTTLCRVCFCAIPSEQALTHHAWHETRKKEEA